MERGIIFNGQEYASPESMPSDVRRAYEEALSGLVNVARSSLPNSALARSLMPRAHSEHFLRAHHRARQTAAWMLPVLLALALGGMLIAGVWLLWPMMNGNLGGRGGDFSIGLGLLIAVTIIAGIGSAVVFLYRRLDSPKNADTEAPLPDERRGFS